MRTLALPPPDQRLEVLCLGAHADDIEIGAAGTILELLAARSDVHVVWRVFSSAGDRAMEAAASAAELLAGAASADVEVFEFRESHFPALYGELKEAFEELARTVHPDLVLTHRRADRHQDHRTIGEMTWNTFRDHLILEYEIPKSDGDLAPPNLYVPLEEKTVEEKCRLLGRHFPSQHPRHWFDDETFRGLMRLRGVECRSQWAEAFHASKIVLGTS